VGPEGATGPLAKTVASRLLAALIAARAATPEQVPAIGAGADTGGAGVRAGAI
jgi:hypothetical protein